MTPESTRPGRTGSGDARQHPGPTRRGVLLGVSLAGLGGTLAGCSTAAVPYAADEAGAAAGGQAPGKAKLAGTVLGAASEIRSAAARSTPRRRSW